MLEQIRRLNAGSEHGIVLFQFIHGWKSNASRQPGAGRRLAWFEERIADIARRSADAAGAHPRAGRPVVGLYVGWRGRTYSLPILIDASFWNRRVAAHRVASPWLMEVLYGSALTANEHPDSKCILVGHSMGGMVLEKTLGPAIVAGALTGRDSELSAPLEYDLVISANPSTEALYSKQLVDIFRRHQLRLVLENERGDRIEAGGPLLASITSEADIVTRWMVPLAMGVNSLFVRYRAGAEPDRPSQRHLGLHTAGHVPFLHSHRVEVAGDDIVFHDIPGRWNDTPFWIFRVPPEVSADHADIDGPLWWRMMLRLTEANRVFDPDLELRLVGASTADSDRL